jgi:hypothetical protein
VEDEASLSPEADKFWDWRPLKSRAKGERLNTREVSCFLFLRIMRIDSSCFWFLFSTIQVIFFLRLFPSKEEEVGAILFEQHSDALKSIFRSLGLEKVSNLQLRPEVWKPL